MDLGVTLAFSHRTPVDYIVGAAQRIEAAGIATLWVPEHVLFFPDYASRYPYSPDGRVPGDPDGILDPFTSLTYVAATTSTLRLGTGICLVPQRQPIYTAKMVADLDYLSGGRFEFGIGIGWLEEEFDALGISWARRGARTDEYVHAMRTLWAGDDASYGGEFVSFENVSSNPKPVGGTVPIVVGGHSAAAARRAGRLGDGFFPGKGSITELTEMVDIVRETAAEHDRDADAIEITAAHPGLFGDDPVGAAQELASIGVSRTIAPAFMLLGSEGVEAKATEMAERIIAPIADI